MGKNILIIEDDSDIQQLLRMALSQGGYNITAALNYKETLNILSEKGDFDVVLMDFYLPELDGLSIADIIFKKQPKLPVVLFTAAEIDDKVDKFPPNIIDVIKKPFTIEEVLEKIDRLLKLKDYFSHHQRPTPVQQVGMPQSITNVIYMEKAESLKKLLNSLSHNIKNALQTISTNIELLEKDFIDEANRERCFQSIKNKIDQIKESLDVLKHPQNLEGNSSFSIKNVIRKVISELKPQMKKKDVFVKTAFEKKIPLYFGSKLTFYTMIKDLFTFLVACIPLHGKLEIYLSLHQQDFFLEIYQSGVQQKCDNAFKFYDLHGENNNIGLTRVVLCLKELNGRIDLSLTDTGGVIIEILLPMQRCIK